MAAVAANSPSEYVWLVQSDTQRIHTNCHFDTKPSFVPFRFSFKWKEWFVWLFFYLYLYALKHTAFSEINVSTHSTWLEFFVKSFCLSSRVASLFLQQFSAVCVRDIHKHRTFRLNGRKISNFCEWKNYWKHFFPSFFPHRKK